MIFRFHLVFLPTTLPSLPPGIMLLNCSTVPRDSATDIKKSSQKGALEREWSNRSVVKMGQKHYPVGKICLFLAIFQNKITTILTTSTSEGIHNVHVLTYLFIYFTILPSSTTCMANHRGGRINIVSYNYY